MQILGILEHLDEPTTSLDNEVPSAAWLHQFLEASKLAFADRNKYIADPEFVDAPGNDWQRMLDAEYLRDRATWISDVSLGQTEPGNPGDHQSLNGT